MLYESRGTLNVLTKCICVEPRESLKVDLIFTLKACNGFFILPTRNSIGLF